MKLPFLSFEVHNYQRYKIKASNVFVENIWASWLDNRNKKLSSSYSQFLGKSSNTNHVRLEGWANWLDDGNQLLGNPSNSNHVCPKASDPRIGGSILCTQNLEKHKPKLMQFEDIQQWIWIVNKWYELHFLSINGRGYVTQKYHPFHI